MVPQIVPREAGDDQGPGTKPQVRASGLPLVTRTYRLKGVGDGRDTVALTLPRNSGPVEGNGTGSRPSSGRCTAAPASTCCANEPSTTPRNHDHRIHAGAHHAGKRHNGFLRKSLRITSYGNAGSDNPLRCAVVVVLARVAQGLCLPARRFRLWRLWPPASRVR